MFRYGATAVVPKAEFVGKASAGAAVGFVAAPLLGGAGVIAAGCVGGGAASLAAVGGTAIGGGGFRAGGAGAEIAVGTGVGCATAGAGKAIRALRGARATKPGAPPKGPSTVTQTETYAPSPMKPSAATGAWDDFLGSGQTNINPRTGLPDPNRIFSADGTRSIRFGPHEMNSSPTKFHYHQETWTYDPVTNNWHVDNVVQRVPLKK
jgi:hypothetical protein